MASAWPQNNDGLNRYLSYSAGVHAAVLVLLLLTGLRPAQKKEKFYSIDFLASPGGFQAPAVLAPAPKAEKGPALPPAKASAVRETEIPVSKKKKPDEKPRETAPEEGPKVMRPSAKDKGTAGIDQVPSVPSEKEGEIGPVASSFPGTGLKTDALDFPYPWYLVQVQSSLWKEWTARMPRGAYQECQIVFSIGKDGKTSGVAVEEGSGNSYFDYAALSAARAAIFPPLPSGFSESELRVHVKFKTVR